MPASSTSLPSQPELVAGLAFALRNVPGLGGPLTVVDRRENEYTSTYPSEVVTCRFGQEIERQFFIKYDEIKARTGRGHWQGVSYEAQVYKCLQFLPCGSLLGFHGTYTNPHTGRLWLILAYVADGMTINKAPRAMAEAARWLGRFHARLEGLCSKPALSFLKVYDAAYYTEWVRKATSFAVSLQERFPWLVGLDEGAAELFAPLLSAQPTMIHGEYYPKNVLWQEGRIYPIDWESAAIAPGAIDLASLTERWDAEVAQACWRAYQRSRWPEGAPTAFERTLWAARLYWHFRWLGDHQRWTDYQDLRYRKMLQRLEKIEALLHEGALP